jgi:alkaline phosphatase
MRAGKGSGLSFQNLPGFSLVTTGATVIGQPELANHYAPGRSLLGSLSSRDNGNGALLLNSCGFPIDFSPLDYAGSGGNMVLWDDKKGGKYPWDARYFQTNPDTSGGFDITYIMQHATDSANTAGCLATGHKAAVGMLSVDLYEEPKNTLIEDALFCNKAGGVVSSVPQLHATPGAFVTHSNSRGNTANLRQGLLGVNPTFVSYVSLLKLCIFEGTFVQRLLQPSSVSWYPMLVELVAVHCIQLPLRLLV